MTDSIQKVHSGVNLIDETIKWIGKSRCTAVLDDLDLGDLLENKLNNIHNLAIQIAWNSIAITR
jgi:hypothetical protein